MIGPEALQRFYLQQRQAGLTKWSRRHRWTIALVITMAAAFSIWAVAAMASELLREDGHAPSALYLLWFLFLTMFWSGLSLLRWRTTLAIAILALSALYAVPLSLFIIIFRLADD